jgi:predicted nucleic acid-binding protein
VIVVDTNVLFHLSIESEQSSLARALFNLDSVWYAPYLWRSEFRNALALKMRHEGLRIESALRTLHEAEFQMFDRERFVDPEHVMRLVSSSTCTAYDCEFVALADELRVPLVTTDKQILRDFPRIAHALADYR